MSFFKASSATDCLDQGKTYMEKGLYFDAIEALDDAVRLDPTSVEAHLKRGVAYAEEEEFDRARRPAGRAQRSRSQRRCA